MTEEEALLLKPGDIICWKKSDGQEEFAKFSHLTFLTNPEGRKTTQVWAHWKPIGIAWRNQSDDEGYEIEQSWISPERVFLWSRSTVNLIETSPEYADIFE